MWFGPPGAGKTTALLTYPSPITFINLDRAPGELTEQLPEHYEINYLRVHYDVDTTPAIANKVLNDIDGAARKAITASKSSGGGSFILDGYDLLWDYVKIAKLPKKRYLPQRSRWEGRRGRPTRHTSRCPSTTRLRW
jgi:hypothetical protein